MRIGIIDDALLLDEIFGFYGIEKYEVSNGEVKIINQNSDFYETEYMTHSTTCCMTLNRYVKRPHKHFLIHINIMKNNRMYITDFVKALEYIDDLEIDILCLSIGTTMISKADKIHPYIKKLHDKGVLIISASSNANYVTYPAAFEEVMGTIVLQGDDFSVERIYALPPNDLGIDLGIASLEYGSNSFSPYLILAHFLNVFECRSFISKEMIYRVISSNEQFLSMQQLEIIEELAPENDESIPIVIVEGEMNLVFMEEMMSCINNTYNYECIYANEGITMGLGERFVKIEKSKLKKQLKNKFNRNVDMIFISLEEPIDGIDGVKVAGDLYIKIDKDCLTICNGLDSVKQYNNLIKNAYDDICDNIVMMLEEV